MNSVLLIGHSIFTAGLRSQVRGLDTPTVTAVTSALESITLLEGTSPDVVVVQACMLREKSVLKTFGQGQSAYMLVIETDALPDVDSDQLVAQQLEKTAQALEAGADAYLWLPIQSAQGQYCLEETSQTLPTPTSEQNTVQKSSAQEFVQEAAQGTGQGTSQYAQTETSQSPADSLLTASLFQTQQCRAIQAHIRTGMSQAQRYRDLSRINDWLSAVALIDALTQINNRRALDLELPNQIKMAKAKGLPFSVMVLDIDYFKSVNDRFGHLIGDDILKQLAKRLLSNMRFYDTPFRYGGEEFVITLNNTDIVEATAIANRLRETIANEHFTLTPATQGLTTLPITVSIGIAELQPEDDDQGHNLIDRADKNLLSAKAAGRNQVVPRDQPTASVSVPKTPPN